MNKYLLACVLFLSFSSIFAQVGPNRYLVYFNDKANSPFSVDNPEEFLSARAISRRAAQNIEITETDIPVNPAYIAEVNEIENVSVVYSLKWFNAVLIETTDSTVLDLIEVLPIVNRYEREKSLTTSLEPAHKPLSAVLHKSEEDYGPSLNQIQMLNGLYLHEEGYMGNGKIIAVLDAGFTRTNSAAALSQIYSNGLLLLTKDFVDGDYNVYHGSTHGTSVLSCMAGILIDSLIGTSPEAKYVLLRTEDTGSERRIEEANWTAAAEFADSMGVDVINTSLGYAIFDLETESYTYEDMDGETTLISRASQIASERGMLLVTSAGNSGDDPFYYIGAPGDAPGVLTVGSVTAAGVASSFSSRGPTFDGRVKPNVMAQGQATVLTDTWDGIQTGNGTSFASPVLAGMAASLWSKYPNATSIQLFDAIEQSASLYLNPNDSMGYGIPNFAIADELLANAVSIADRKRDEMQLNVFPNPFSSEFNIQFHLNKAENIEIRIMDISGKIIYASGAYYSPGIQTIKLAAEETFAAGIYVLQLYANSGIHMEKLIIKSSE